MDELEKKKRMLEAIKQAIAIMNLEIEFNISYDLKTIDDVKNKVLKLGGKDEELGRLCR